MQRKALLCPVRLVVTGFVGTGTPVHFSQYWIWYPMTCFPLVLEGKDISHRLSDGHKDLDRWQQGGLDVQFFPCGMGKGPDYGRLYQDALKEIHLLDSIIAKPGPNADGYPFPGHKTIGAPGQTGALIGVKVAT